jgi:hypothetical protein
MNPDELWIKRITGIVARSTLPRVWREAETEGR